MVSSKPAKPINRHLWLVESLENDPTFLLKSMFGSKAAYLEGRMVLVLADKKEPWRGVVVPMERDQHAALIEALPSLSERRSIPGTKVRHIRTIEVMLRATEKSQAESVSSRIVP